MSDTNAENPNPPVKKLPTGRIAMIVGAMVVALLIVSATINWMPAALGFAPQVDPLFFFIYWVSVFFTLLIAGTLVFFLFYYQQTDKAAPAPGKVTHSTALELTWTIIPVFIVLAIFAWGFKGYMDMAVPPTGAKEVLVVAQQWGWAFRYDNGYWDNDLHIPAGRDVKLVLSSNDVIHSLYIKQFRAKKDVVPGRFNIMWVRGDWIEDDPDIEYAVLDNNAQSQVMVLDLYCTEYCGLSHSQMNRKVYVHRDQASFNAWLEEASIPWNNERFAQPAAWGRQLWQNRCASCHSIDGSSGSGPSWLNVYGYEREMTDGQKVLADKDYIRESIIYPQRLIVKGYERQNMASFAGQLKDWDIYAIIQFMQTLSDRGQAVENWDEIKPAEE